MRHSIDLINPPNPNPPSLSVSFFYPRQPNLPLDKQLSVYASADLSEPHLTSLPPDFVAVPCKPVFFDLAGNEIEFPDIASRVKGGAASAATSSTPAAASEDGDSGGEPEEPKQSGGWFSSWVG